MSLAREFPNYNPYSSPAKFKREVKKFLFDLKLLTSLILRNFLMIFRLAKRLGAWKSNTYLVVLTLLMESAQSFGSLLCIFHYVKIKTSKFCVFSTMEPSHRKHISKTWAYFFRKFIMGSSLKFCFTKCKSEACLSKENYSKSNKIISQIQPSQNLQDIYLFYGSNF